MKVLKSNSSPDIKIFLIGNKIDLEDNRVVKYEQGRKLELDYNLDFFTESSAREGTNVEYIFGQAAKLLYNDFIKYKATGHNLLRNIESTKLAKKNINNNKKKKCC